MKWFQERRTNVTLWQYRVLTKTAIDLEQALNEAGMEGYDVVFSQFSPMTPEKSEPGLPEMHNPLVTVILKRPAPAY